LHRWQRCMVGWGSKTFRNHDCKYPLLEHLKSPCKTCIGNRCKRKKQEEYKLKTSHTDLQSQMST
jgi:hypothetical protein